MNAAVGFGLIICLFVLVIIGMVIGFLARNVYYKEVDELEKKKNTLSDRGVVEELAKVKELTMNGETEVHFEEWRAQWDEIVSSVLPKITFDLMEVDEFLGKYRFDKAKRLLKQIHEEISVVEEQIQHIFQGVNELMESYERNNEEIAIIQKKYKNLKKALLAHRHSFTLVEKEVEEQLEGIQQQVIKHESLIKNGDYFQAANIVDETLETITHLEVVMDEIPQLQVECQTSLPAQIENIADGYEDMRENGYVLTHLNLDEEIEGLKEQNDEMLALVKELKVQEVKMKLEDAKLKIDTIYDVLEAEVAARQQVLGEIEQIHGKMNHIKTENKKSKEETATVKLSYQLNDKEIETQKYIEKQLAVLVKRYQKMDEQLSTTELAYSVASQDLKDIHQKLDELTGMQVAYTESLQTLRGDELKAQDEIGKMRHILQETKRVLAVSNLPGVPESYYERYSEATEKMRLVQNHLHVKPLNMVMVNQSLHETVELVEAVYKEAIEMVERAYLVEQVIQYGNRYRSRNSRIANALHKAEYLFRKYQYQEALEEAAAAIDGVDPGAINRIQTLISEKKTSLY